MDASKSPPREELEVEQSNSGSDLPDQDSHEEEADESDIAQAGNLIEELNCAIDEVNTLGDEHDRWLRESGAAVRAAQCCASVLLVEIKPRLNLLSALREAQAAVASAQEQLTEAEVVYSDRRSEQETLQSEVNSVGLWEARMQLSARLAVLRSTTSNSGKAVDSAKRAIRSASAREDKARKAVERALVSSGSVAPSDDELALYDAYQKRRGDLDAMRSDFAEMATEWESRKTAASDKVSGAMAALETLSEEIHQKESAIDNDIDKGIDAKAEDTSTLESDDGHTAATERSDACTVAVADVSTEASSADATECATERDGNFDSRGIFGRRRVGGGNSFRNRLSESCSLSLGASLGASFGASRLSAWPQTEPPTSAQPNAQPNALATTKASTQASTQASAPGSAASGAPAAVLCSTLIAGAESAARPERLRDEVFEASLTAMGRLLRTERWERRRLLGRNSLKQAQGSTDLPAAPSWLQWEECLSATLAMASSGCDSQAATPSSIRRNDGAAAPAEACTSSGTPRSAPSADNTPLVRRVARLFGRNSSGGKALQGGYRHAACFEPRAWLDWEGCVQETLDQVLPVLCVDRLEETDLFEDDPDSLIETQYI